GDAHCRQGNGEVNLTALECAYREIEIQPIVRKDLKIDWPRAETHSDWILTAFDEDLSEAMKIAVRETVNFLASQTLVPMSRDEAYALASMGGRLPRDPGGGHPQRRALPGAQVSLRHQAGCRDQ